MVLLKLKNFDSLDIGISIVPYSNAIKLNCALFQCPKIELCLVPVIPIEIVPYSIVANLNWALIQ